MKKEIQTFEWLSMERMRTRWKSKGGWEHESTDSDEKKWNGEWFLQMITNRHNECATVSIIIYFRKLNQGNDKHSMFLVYFIFKVHIWRILDGERKKVSVKIAKLPWLNIACHWLIFVFWLTTAFESQIPLM